MMKFGLRLMGIGVGLMVTGLMLIPAVVAAVLILAYFFG